MACAHVQISMNSSCKLVLGFHVQCALIKCLLGDKVAKMDRKHLTTCQEPCPSTAKKDIDWDKCVIYNKSQLKLSNAQELQREVWMEQVIYWPSRR